MADIVSSSRGRAARPSRLRQGVIAAAFVAVAALMGTSPAAAQAPLGTALAVRPAAEGQLGGARVTLVDGASLFEGQTIATDATGEVQILFADNTRMVVGPSSTLVIETYLLQNPTTVGNLTVNALGGTFRFISGNSPSAAYHINTPTGTIGVRGTELDITVDDENDVVYIVVYQGEVFFCNTAGVCVDLEARCQVGVMADNLADVITQQRPRFAITRQQFLYAIGQWRLLDPFQVEDPRECLFANAGGAGTNINPSGGGTPDPSPSGPPSSSSSGGSKWPSKGKSSYGPDAICEAILNGNYNLPIPGWVYTYCYGPGK